MSRVLFVQATDPAAYPPLIHAGTLIAERGHRVRYLSSPIAGRAMRLPDLTGLDVVEIPARPTHVMDSASYARYLATTWRAARAFRPDVVYASDPLGALPGLLAAALAGAPLVYHEHDSPGSERQLHRIVRMARRAALRRARLIVFPNAARAGEVAKEIPFRTERLRVVWNLPRRSEVRAPASRNDGPLMLYYHGSITPERLPLELLEAVLRFPDVRLRVVGYETAGAMGHLAALRSLAESAGRRDAIEIHGEVSRCALPALMAAADIGLALMPTASSDINMRHMAGASNKAFDYLAGGLALLISDLPDWRRLFVEPGYGLACDPNSVDSIAGAIRWCLDHRDEVRAMADRGRQRVLADWNYDTAFEPVLAALSLDR